MSRELGLTEELSQIPTKHEAPNAALQLRRAISIRAEGIILLEKARYRAVSCRRLLAADDFNPTSQQNFSR